MLLSKRKLINSLFLLSFPIYGIGMYVGYKTSISQGTVVAVGGFLGIIIIHVLDLIAQRQVRNMVTRKYWWGLLFLISLIASMWKALAEHFPGATMANTVAYTIMFLAPYHAAIIVHIRNRDQEDFDFARMVLISLSLFLFINLLGVAAGMHNVLHNIEGRLNLPFVLGIYDAAHMLAMINLMLMFYMKDFVRRPMPFLGMLLFYLVNVVLMLKVNSRLSFMTFALLTGLFLFRMIGRARLMFPLSLFTMTILTNFALLVYTILTLPFMRAIVSRVNKEDVTTFNNRTTVWDVGWNWLEKDRHGLWFGHGYQGQIHLKGWDHIAEVFNVKDVQNVHMHSTFMQTLINQGVVGYTLLLIVVWFTFTYFRKRFHEGTLETPLFALMVYMLFILQIDIICYGNDFGNALLFCLFAMVVMDPRHITRRPRTMDGGPLDPASDAIAPRSDDAS
ncbi:MAG TPA: O-antigen ligase family protein [Flavobacteriales bacterium]|nr:O-antigen ligase family protein [Flavobacteriales bacterium]